MNTRNKRITKRRYKGRLHVFVVIAAVLAGMAIVGLVWRSQSQVKTQLNMISTCEHSYQVTDGLLEADCGDLIDQVQADGKHEVLYNDRGEFHVDTK